MVSDPKHNNTITISLSLLTYPSLCASNPHLELEGSGGKPPCDPPHNDSVTPIVRQVVFWYHVCAHACARQRTQ